MFRTCIQVKVKSIFEENCSLKHSLVNIAIYFMLWIVLLKNISIISCTWIYIYIKQLIILHSFMHKINMFFTCYSPLYLNS